MTAVPTEHQEQVAVLEWARVLRARWPELDLLFAIPNAAKRSLPLARYLQAEGMRAGVPDLFLPVAREGWHGLFLEMKRRKGARPTAEQRQWHRHLFEQGYFVEVCAGADHAIDVLWRYLAHDERVA